MAMTEIELEVFNESGYDVPVDERIARKCLSEIARQEACHFNMIELVYVGPEKIKEINAEHLDHHYVTDIITFRYDDDPTNNEIEGTLFCCAQRIADQAAEYDQEEKAEFKRVLIHGLLHLAGYDDKSEHDKTEMRKREDFYLSLL